MVDGMNVRDAGMTMSEIASRIAAATRSNIGGADRVEFGKGKVLDTAPCEALPVTEWSPTIGQPEAANSGDDGYAEGNDFALRVMRGEANLVAVGTVAANDNYTTLRTILDAAFAHAATGKGKERHARDLPFDKQPMLETTRLVGPGFPLGQAIKKAGEAAGMIERGDLGAAEAECLGAINYLAGAVAWMREQGNERRSA